MSYIIVSGVYEGIPYELVDRVGKKHVSLLPSVVAELHELGANVSLLENIGNQDVLAAIKATIESVPDPTLG